MSVFVLRTVLSTAGPAIEDGGDGGDEGRLPEPDGKREKLWGALHAILGGALMGL